MNKKKYDIIYADPPWQYDSGRSIAKVSHLVKSTGNNHYDTMSIEQLKNLDLHSISSDNSLCFMWCVSPKLVEGISVLEAWGFKYRTIAFVWYKRRSNPGYYTMSQCEICIVGKRGKFPKPRGSRNQKQFYCEKRTKHSKKPNEFRDRITNMFPEQSKIELFAREKNFGWDVFGNEVENDIDF